MSQDGTQSSRGIESNQDVALKQIREACQEFEHQFTELFRAGKTYSLFSVRLEVKSAGGMVTDIDVNRYSKRQPTGQAKRK